MHLKKTIEEWAADLAHEAHLLSTEELVPILKAAGEKLLVRGSVYKRSNRKRPLVGNTTAL